MSLIKLILFVLLWVGFDISALAEQCVLQDKVVTRSQIRIDETTQITATVVPALNGEQRCMVNLRARIASTWYTGFGEYTWQGNRPREEACAMAVKRAQDSVLDRAGNQQVISDKVLICNDQTNLNQLRSTNPGTIAELAQFRPHPDYPKEFWHNTAKCRWFLESAFTGNDMRPFQGIICQVQDSKWVVVDKF